VRINPGHRRRLDPPVFAAYKSPALRYWYLGGEWLALSHLWMAGEALTQALINYEARRRGIDQEGLADALGISLDDPDRRWKLALKHETRRALIFRGDDDTYSTASKGRNRLEHGFMGIDEVAAHAVNCADKPSNTYAGRSSTSSTCRPRLPTN
jgi:hypothetical protein